MTVPAPDKTPTDPPTPPTDPPTPPPTDPAPTPEHASHDDGPILAAIGELKNMITGLATVATAQPDESPAKRPWFARGGRS